MSGSRQIIYQCTFVKMKIIKTLGYVFFGKRGKSVEA